jgi:hypothetical protein
VFLQWLLARLSEPSTWLGIAAFSASTGAALVSAGFTNAGLIIGAIGARLRRRRLLHHQGKGHFVNWRCLICQDEKLPLEMDSMDCSNRPQGHRRLSLFDRIWDS